MENNCMYCTEDERLSNLMLPVCKVGRFQLYLNKNQTYRGRSILAFNRHVGKLSDLSKQENADFFDAVHTVAQALQKTFSPGQINIGLYADKVPHLHCHFAPKYVDELDWGGTFQMNPTPEVFLSEQEYQEIISQIRENL